MSTTDRAISIVELVGRAAAFGESALPVAQFIAGWIPGGGPVLQAITAALPIIRKIAAGASVATKALEAGRPIIEAVEKSGPGVMTHVRELLAIAINHDPDRPETNMTAADVTDKEVEKFATLVFTPGWTNEETQVWWDRASSVT